MLFYFKNTHPLSLTINSRSSIIKLINFRIIIQGGHLALPKEIQLETLLTEILIENGYIQGIPQDFDKFNGIDRAMLLRFIETTQKETLEMFKNGRGANWEKLLIERISSEIDRRGLVDVLRYGVEDYTINGKFDLAYFKPNSKLNESLWEKYNKNILAITRQLKYSLKNENSIDTVIFLNGFPIVIMELKNQFTSQNVWNAVKQFKEEVCTEENFKKLSLHKQKEIFIKMLDLNQLYVNLSDMEDKKYNLSAEDIAITKDFYQL